MDKIDNAVITYNLLSIEHLDEILPIAVDLFVLSEGVTRSLKATPDDFKPMLSDGVREWIKEGISYGAWDSATGQLVGVLISTLLSKQNGAPDIWGNLKSTNPISEIYVAFEKTIEGSVDIFELYPSVERILELNLMCILPAYRGRKIGQTLVKHAENMGLKMNCTMAMAEASGRASQKILLNLGYKTVFEYPYENFEFEGKKVFDLSVMGDDLSDMIMVKELSLCKEDEIAIIKK